MAVIAPTITKDELGPGNVKVTWAGVTEADTFGPWNKDAACGSYQDKTVQVLGTFGGATIVINGSIGGTVYAGLHDPGGTLISIATASAIEAILENVPFIQPAHSGGSSESITVELWARSNHP